MDCESLILLTVRSQFVCLVHSCGRSNHDSALISASRGEAASQTHGGAVSLDGLPDNELLTCCSVISECLCNSAIYFTLSVFLFCYSEVFVLAVTIVLSIILAPDVTFS